jgi:hypothetical protein
MAARRITFTAAPGQYEVLEKIAKENDTKISFVVRYIINRYLREVGPEPQLRLDL